MRKILLSEDVKSFGHNFRDITNQLPIGIIIFQDGFVSYVNNALSNIIEYSKEEIRKWSNYDFFKYVYPYDLPLIKVKFEQQQNMRIGGFLKYSLRAISKSKKIKWVELSSKSILYQGNAVILISVIDLTEKKEAEQKLRESEERYRLISENTSNLISILNDKFEYEFINEQAYMNILGYTSKDILGKNCLDLVHPDDLKKNMKILKKSFKSGEEIEAIRLKHKNGYYIWVKIRGKQFTDYNGKVKILSISRDITEKKQIEHKLKELSRVINIAGRQRILSQKMSKEALIKTILRSNKKKKIEK